MYFVHILLCHVLLFKDYYHRCPSWLLDVTGFEMSAAAIDIFDCGQLFCRVNKVYLR